MEEQSKLYRGNKTLMPRCVAMYDRGDVQCDGDRNGRSDTDKLPCVFRDRCVAMGIYQLLHQLDRGQLVRIVEAKSAHTHEVHDWAIAAGDQKALFGALDDVAKKYKIRDGIAGAAPDLTALGVRPATGEGLLATRELVNKPTLADPSPKSRKAKRRQGRDAGAWAVVNEMQDHYMENIRTRLKRRMAQDQSDAAMGELFLVDRKDKGNYVSLYVRSNAPIGRSAVTSVYFKPNKGNVEVRVAASYRQFTALLSAANAKSLKPEDWTGLDGSFHVRFKNMDKGRLGILAEAIERAVLGGIISLPSVGA